MEDASFFVAILYSALYSPAPLSPVLVSCRCDVGAATEVADAVAKFSKGGGIAGVLHAGGVLRDALLSQQTASHVRDVYAPKARGGQLILQVQKQGPWYSPMKLLCRLLPVLQGPPAYAVTEYRLQIINSCMPTCEQAVQQQAAQKVVLFSSIAALTGPAGSSNYAAANALLDAAAEGCQGTGWVCRSCLSVCAMRVLPADHADCNL